MTVSLVWYDGFGRHHEEVTEVSSTAFDKTFRDAEGVEFTVHNNQIVRLGDVLTPETDATPDDSYGDVGAPEDAG